MSDKKELPKPKDVAKQLNMSVEDMLNIGVERLSSDSLSKLAKTNPQKYKMQILGIVCMNLDIDIDELKDYSKLRDTIKSKL